MKKEKAKLLFALVCVGALCLGAGFMIGAGYTIHEAIRSLEYVDNVNIDVDINETHMVDAMIPYIEEYKQSSANEVKR